MSEETVRLPPADADTARQERLRKALGDGPPNDRREAPGADLVLQLQNINNSPPDLQRTLVSVCQSAVRLLKAEHSSFMMFDVNWEKGKVCAEYPHMGVVGTQIPLQGGEGERSLYEAGEPIPISDVKETPHSCPAQGILRGLNIRSTLIVPIIGKNGPVGAFSLDSIRRKRKFTKKELELCKVFAAQAAIVIENSQLFGQLETLRKAMMAITSPSEPEGLLRTIVGKAIELLNGKSGGIYEFDPERGRLKVVADHNRDVHVGRTLELGEGIAGRLVESGAPYKIVDDYNTWEGRAAIYEDERRYGAVLEVPFKWDGNIIGVLYVTDEVGRKFTENDAARLAMFADYAAVPLISRLSQSLNARDSAKLKRLERLSEVSKDFLSDLGSSSLDDRLNLIARYATEVLEAEVCGVLLVRSGLLSLEASHGHREGGFQKGKTFKIRSGQGTGLTGHIAARGELFNLHGEKLVNHFAVRGVEPDCTPSGRCTSLLAIPLKKKTRGGEQLVGLLRVGNKKDKDGRPLPTLTFTKEDEWLLRIFAEAVVTAIDSAALVESLNLERARQARLIDSSPNGIIYVDNHGVVTQSNEKAREIFGYGGGEALPARVWDLYHDPAEASRIGQLLRDGKGGKLKDYHTFIRGMDGRPLSIRLSATWLKDAKGDPIGSVGYFEDLRTIQEAEKRLKLLLKAGNMVAQAESLEKGLEKLAEMVVSLLSNSFCRILLYDESRSYLKVEAAHPIPRPNGELSWVKGVGDRVQPSEYEGLAEFLSEGKTKLFRADDKEYQGNFEKFTARLHLKGCKVQSLLMVPLKDGDEVMGLLDAGEFRDPKRSSFTEEKIDLAAGIGAQISLLIRRLRLFENAERRRELMTALVEKMRYLRGEKEPSKLAQEAVRLCVELMEAKSGALFTYHQHSGSLEGVATFNLNLPPERPLTADDGIAGLVARTGETRIVHDYGNWPERDDVFDSYHFGTVVGVPLKGADGDVSHVLVIAGKEGERTYGEAESEILERFVAQVSIAIQTSELFEGDGRKLAYLKVLHQVSEFILSAADLDSILDAVLTGVTAGYGLGFNRAVLLLLDEGGEQLEGRKGIGYWTKEDTEASWERDHAEGLYDFNSYCKRLRQNQLRATPVGAWAQSFALPVERMGDHFSRALHTGRSSSVRADGFTGLPKNFIKGFKPTSEIAVVPLSVNDKGIGVLVVDNHITRSPITDADLKALLTFANTLALAIDKFRLVESIERGSNYLRKLFEASNALSNSEDPEQVLEDILNQTREVVRAAWVRVILTDEAGRPRHFISKGAGVKFKIEDLLRAGGLGERALKTGEIQIIENTHKSRDMVNPVTMPDCPEARVCVPLALAGKKLGLMWIGYDRPRTFTEMENEALKLYVNQAAIAYDSARRIKELELMRQAAEALARETNTQGVLKQIVESAKTALQAEWGALWTYDETRGVFDPEGWFGSGISREVTEKFWKAAPREGGTAYRVMADGWVTVEDVDDTGRYPYIGESTRSLLDLYKTRSFLGVALVVGDEKLGVLYLNYSGLRSFGDEEQQTARTFANHAALALKKAQLVEQLSKITQAAEAVAKVTVLGDLKATLSLIANETREALDCDAVVLYEYDKDAQRVGHPPTMCGVKDEAAARRHKAERDSIVYKILFRDEPAFVERAAEAPLFDGSRFTREEGIASCVGIPLKVEHERVGVMFVNYWNPHRFTPEQQNNVGLFANQAAIAIRNAQLYEARNKRLSEQQELINLSEKLLGTLSAEEAMREVVEAAARMLDVRFSCIVLQEPGEDYVFSAAHGWEHDLVGNFKLSVGSQTAFTVKEDKAVVVTDYATEERFEVNPLILKMKFRAGLSVPMRQEGVVGALLLHTRDERYFTEDEARLLQLIANQTAIAIESARRFENSQRERTYLHALHEVSKAIAASMSLNQRNVLDRRQVLSQIVCQAYESIKPKAAITSIFLRDEQTNELIFESMHPAERYPDLMHRLGERIPLDRKRLAGGRLGINGRAAVTGETQLVGDVTKDEDYWEINPSTRSELSIPLKDEDGKVLGVLNLESELPDGFDREDCAHLEALAQGMVIIVIKNARQFQELMDTKNMVDSSKALAHISMAGTEWAHAIWGHAINIRDVLTLLREDVSQWSLDERKLEELEKRLASIESLALKIEKRDIVPPLSSEKGVEPVEINELVRAHITLALNGASWSKVECDLSGLSSKEIKVRISREWFRRALDTLVKNAIKATDGRLVRRLSVSSRLASGQVEIEISDTGGGIPDEFKDRVFRERIQIPGRTEGLGVGLLIAQSIVQAYKGEIRLKETSHHGTTFVISLPAGT
jgi:PAS domain S-box-containing protein